MSARLDDIAADVAWARPARIDASLILNYSGPAFAGLDQLRAWGKPFLIGFESSTTRAYSGATGGVQDAQELLSVVRSIPGYVEGGCGTWFCAADENTTPAWAWPGITDYADAFTTTLLSAGWHPMVELPYGNPDAVGAAIAGIIRAGGPPGPWGVGTWRFGEGGGPNQPPSSSDAWLVQSGNTPGPADGTDLDWMYRPLADFGAYGGPTPEPEDEDMKIAYITSPSHPDHPYAWDGMTRRLVLSDEWELIMFATGGHPNGPDKPAVEQVSDQMFDSIPDITDMPQRLNEVWGTLRGFEYPPGNVVPSMFDRLKALLSTQP